MPIYEYQCPGCGHTFEKLQFLQERAALCPACGTDAEKVMSASVGFIMKETGYPAGGHGAQDRGPCCGQASPCEHPKRCCTR